MKEIKEIKINKLSCETTFISRVKGVVK